MEEFIASALDQNSPAAKLKVKPLHLYKKYEITHHILWGPPVWEIGFATPSRILKGTEGVFTLHTFPPLCINDKTLDQLLQRWSLLTTKGEQKPALWAVIHMMEDLRYECSSSE